MATNRVKVFNSLNGDAMNWGSVPSTDGFVDIDSVQTVSNKVFVNCTISSIDPSRLSLLMFKSLILGQSMSLGGSIAVSPGLVSYIPTALATT